MALVKLDDEFLQAIITDYPRPALSMPWLTRTCRDIFDRHAAGGTQVDLPTLRREVDGAVRSSRLYIMTLPGTGLPDRIGKPHIHITLEGPILLEIVHMTDIGVSAFALERTRQDRDRRSLLDRIARTKSKEGANLRDMERFNPNLAHYARSRLKLVLTDGFVDLEAVECERLPLELGCTPMGTKLRVVNAPIIEGVAYLRRENVSLLGGGDLDPELEREHQQKLCGELEKRMREEESWAEEQGVPPQDLYSLYPEDSD